MITTIFFYALVCTVYAQQDGLGAYSSTGHLRPGQTQYLAAQPAAATFAHAAPRVRASIPVVEKYSHSSSNPISAIQSAPAYPAAVQYAVPQYSVLRLAAPEYSAPRLAAPVYSEPRASTPAYVQSDQEEFAHPQYEYGYSIEDYHSGDLHSQQEQRNGEHVSGQYSLREADGSIRVVKYFDKGHGFNAVVEKLPGPQQEIRKTKISP